MSKTTKLDPSKVESISITALRQLIDGYPCIVSEINQNDKGICWDGFLVVYDMNEDNNDNVLTKENFGGKVPIQIKGTQSSKHRISANRLTYNVSTNDLKAYFKEGGCLYIVVYIKAIINEPKTEIYYRALHPADIKCMFGDINNINQKSKSIKFNRIINAEDLHRILRQFIIESRKQGSGEGQIVSRLIADNQLENIKSISFASYNKGDINYLIRNIDWQG